jgi:hypothetical protein
VLAVDEHGKPVGWLDADRMLPDDEVAAELVEPLGGTFRREDSIRAALDAAVLAASGQAICVDGSGEVVGAVSHAEIARYLTSRRPVVDAA